MKISKYLAVASVALIAAACSNDESPLQAGEQDLTLRLSDPVIARAVEAPIADQSAVNFQDVTLKFWSGANGTGTETPLVLTAAQITAAKTPEGAIVKMPAGTVSVSMVANTSVTATDITGYQALGADFLSKVPMTSPAVAPTTHTTIATAKEVTLVPVPDMARIEIAGSIVPTAPAGKTSAYKSVTVEAVYVNNYKATATATAPTKIEATGDWSAAYATTMRDFLTDEDRTALTDKSKASAFQVYPATAAADADNLPHIILKVKYVLNTTPETTKENRYITIKGYKSDATTALTAIEAGKIYKLDLASLNDSFGTDDSGNPIDPTDETPEADKTDLYVKITAYQWTAVNIIPDL